MEKALELRTITENVVLTVVTLIYPDITSSSRKQNGRACNLVILLQAHNVICKVHLKKMLDQN
jgi:hypothetical protein